MVYRASPTQLNMQLIKQMCTLLPRHQLYLTIQSHNGFSSIYFNCKAIRGSRCVLEAADVTCGHSRGDSNYHDNTNYTNDNQLNRIHSWAALGMVEHRSSGHDLDQRYADTNTDVRRADTITGFRRCVCGAGFQYSSQPCLIFL